MKKSNILQAVLLVAGVVIIAGCSTGRYYSNYPPPRERYGTSVSLIIRPYASLNITRYDDGRYCYRDPKGYIYWRGNDNRYYLDQSFIGRINFDRSEYREWKHFRRWRDRDDD